MRIKAKWTPTPIRTERTSLEVRVPEPARSRVWDLITVVVVLAWLRVRGYGPKTLGRFLSESFTEWGGLWIKVLQWISVHQDLFSEDFCAEMTASQGRALCMPSTHAKKILGDALALPIAVVFDTFDWEPRFAASMGTIWKARLRHEQVTVAVKIRPPFLEEQMHRDLTLLRRTARVLTYVMPRWRPTEMVAELTRICREELDFRYEANAQTRMRRDLREMGLYAPKVFGHYSSERVLVTEWVDAVPLTDYLELLQDNPRRAARWLAENDIRPAKSARVLLLSLFEQIFERNRVHCDLHPGNIGWLRGGRTVVFDFGATCRTERAFLAAFKEQITAIVTGQFAWAAELCLLLCAGLPKEPFWIFRLIASWRQKRKIADLVTALKDGMKDWSTRAEIAELPYHEKSLNACSLMMMKTVMRSGGAMAWEWTRLNKATTTLDATVAKLYPALNYPKLVRRYFRDAAQRVPLLAPVHAFVALVRRLPMANRLADRFEGYIRLLDQERRQLSMLVTG